MKDRKSQKGIVKVEVIETKTKDMNCPNRHETLGDQNHFECPCPKD